MQTKSLIVTYGLPGSGKSTWADAFCAQDPRLRRAFGRDRIRRLLGTPLGRSRTADDERRVTEKQRELISDWLERGAGMVAVLDETSINTPIGAWAEWLDATYPLPQPEPWQLQAEAERGLQFIRYQHRFAVADLSWVPLRTCLARNAARPRETRVPYAEMRRMYRAMRPLPAGVRSFRADPSRGRDTKNRPRYL